MNALLDSAHFLKTLTSIFSLLSIAILAYIVLNIFVFKPQFSSSSLDIAPPRSVPSVNLPVATSFSSYAEAVKKRNIFEPPAPPKTIGTADPVRLPAVAIRPKAPTFKVTAILLGNQPQAIIEDERQHKTYFVSPGEQVDGMSVESIQEHKVTLKDQTQHLELTL